MKISTIIIGFILLFSTIITKSVIHLDEFFKEIPIESSTAKNYFRVPNYIEGGMSYVFKIFKPYDEDKIDLDFRAIRISENATDDDIINGEKWVSLTHPSSHSWDDYDIYYYHLDFEADVKFAGVYISSSQDYKMTFSIRGNGYVFPIKLKEETIIEDFNTGHFLQGPVGKGKMSLVVKVYRPVEVVDFRLDVSFWKIDNPTDYEIRRNSPQRKDLTEFKIQEEDDYIIFRYYINYIYDEKSLTFYFDSLQHYTIGFYLDYEPY
jgi:hypothetical protein